MCVWLNLNLKSSEQSAHVARRVVVHQGKHDRVHERNDVLRPVGRDAQQNIGTEHVEQKYEINETGKVEHYVGDLEL